MNDGWAFWPADDAQSSDLCAPLFCLVFTLQIASTVHVFLQSSRDRRIGNRWWHAGMNLLVCWPLSYLFWIFLWPGSLRQTMFGTDRAMARTWARLLIKDRRRAGGVGPTGGGVAR